MKKALSWAASIMGTLRHKSLAVLLRSIMVATLSLQRAFLAVPQHYCWCLSQIPQTYWLFALPLWASAKAH
jgi:hypothetical protein